MLCGRLLASPPVASETSSSERDLVSLVVLLTGSVVETADPLEPYQLLDGSGRPVAAVTSFLRELLASARAPSTLRSYAVDLLRWMRFLAAVDVAWDQATPVEGRDFSLWIRQVRKPGQRPPSTGVAGREDRKPQSRRQGLAAGTVPGEANRVTGKPSPGQRYAPRTVNHCETVLRTFYDFHREAGTGPMVNPFPLDRSRRGGRSHAHHNPMDPWKREREGRYRSSVPQRGRPGRSRKRCSSCCSPRCHRTVIGRWWRFGSPRERARRSCWAPGTGMPIQASN